LVFAALTSSAFAAALVLSVFAGAGAGAGAGAAGFGAGAATGAGAGLSSTTDEQAITTIDNQHAPIVPINKLLNRFIQSPPYTAKKYSLSARVEKNPNARTSKLKP
jgi:hypothetical protein